MTSEGADRTGLTRRSLLKASGVAVGTAALGGCLSPSGDESGDDTLAGLDTAFGNCWICCHNCGQEVTVDDGTVVEITGVDGHPRGSAGPGTEGTLCPEGVAQLDKTHDPERKLIEALVESRQ